MLENLSGQYFSLWKPLAGIQDHRGDRFHADLPATCSGAAPWRGSALQQSRKALVRDRDAPQIGAIEAQ
jgi:hypothetical protein